MHPMYGNSGTITGTRKTVTVTYRNGSRNVIDANTGELLVHHNPTGAPRTPRGRRGGRTRRNRRRKNRR